MWRWSVPLAHFLRMLSTSWPSSRLPEHGTQDAHQRSVVILVKPILSPIARARSEEIVGNGISPKRAGCGISGMSPGRQGPFKHVSRYFCHWHSLYCIGERFQECDSFQEGARASLGASKERFSTRTGRTKKQVATRWAFCCSVEPSSPWSAAALATTTTTIRKSGQLGSGRDWV